MSFWIPNKNGTDLSSAQAGTTGTIPIPVPYRPGNIGNKTANLVFNNESGCGLAINFVGSNREVFLPAGAWTRPIPLNSKDTAISYYVAYVLPNSPVSALYIVLYSPGEQPLETTALGNSPIGISGNVQTSNVQSLTNDGQAPETTVIEMTPQDQVTSSVVIRNTASGFLQVLSANVLRKIISVVRGNAGTGKAQIQFGDSGDASISIYYGNLDQIRSDSGAVTSNGSGTVSLTQLNFLGGPFISWNAAQNALGVRSNLSGGVATGIYFTSWTGSATNIPFSVGGQFNGADCYVDNSGNFIGNAVIVQNAGSYLNSINIGPPSGSGVYANISIDTAGHFFNLWTPNVTGVPWSLDLHVGNGSGNITALHLDGATGNVVIPQIATDNSGNSYAICKSAGGGSAGRVMWEGTTDPGASANEGDLWMDG